MERNEQREGVVAPMQEDREQIDYHVDSSWQILEQRAGPGDASDTAHQIKYKTSDNSSDDFPCASPVPMPKTVCQPSFKKTSRAADLSKRQSSTNAVVGSRGPRDKHP